MKIIIWLTDSIENRKRELNSKGEIFYYLLNENFKFDLIGGHFGV